MTSHLNLTQSRREFLRSTTAMLAMPLVRSIPLSSAVILPTISSARADGGATAVIVIAVIQAVIGLASSLGAFGSRAGGMGQRLQSINIKLNQILINQEVILGAIGAVNSSIEALSKRVEHLFQDDRLKKAYDEATKIHLNIRGLIEEILADSSKLNSQNYYEQSFLQFRPKLDDAFTELHNRVSESSMENGGVPLAVLAVQTAYILAEAQRLYAKLEFMFPDNISRELWVPHVAFKNNIERLDKIVSDLEEDRFREAREEQVEIARVNKNAADASTWYHFSDLLLSTTPTVTIRDTTDGFKPKPKSISVSFEAFVNQNKPNCPSPKKKIQKMLSNENWQDHVVNPVFKPDEDSFTTEKINRVKHTSTNRAEVFDFEIVTANLLGGESADTIILATKIAHKGGSRKKETQVECGSGPFGTIFIDSPADLFAGIARTSQFYLSAKGAPISRLDANLASWQLAIAQHGQAQAYILALSKLFPVLESIKSHNDAMKNTFLPALTQKYRAQK